MAKMITQVTSQLELVYVHDSLLQNQPVDTWYE